VNRFVRSADFQSAVSPISNRQRATALLGGRPAECNSAIQQIGNLRYVSKALVLGLAVALQPRAVLACAACYGASDSPMAQGMNWGIFTLLGVVVGVLGGIAGFFIYLARRSATTS